ncbi:MAG: hypothetical protein ACRDRB_22535, partial [Pseudonocardiaceae bacterium]
AGEADDHQGQHTEDGCHDAPRAPAWSATTKRRTARDWWRGRRHARDGQALGRAPRRPLVAHRWSPVGRCLRAFAARIAVPEARWLRAIVETVDLMVAFL